MIKSASYFLSACLSVILLSGTCLAKSHHDTAKHQPQTNTPHKETKPAAAPQIEVYEAHKGEDQNYVIALYTHHPGSALISYNSPACQADSHGTTVLNPKVASEITFISKEDPHCHITFKKNNNNTLEVTQETLACSAWQGDFCSFKTIPVLNRIYPQSN